MSYSRLARRMRVPLGFFLAAVYLWLAWPTWASIAAGAVIVAAGLWFRALASGHVRKNAELTTTGPYAHTRNPLYLGPLIIGIACTVASRGSWLALLIGAVFLAVYVPGIKSHEADLTVTFP